MGIWVLDYRSVDAYGGNDFNTTLWSTKEDALKQACSEIQEDICNHWDLDCPDIHAIARDIFDSMVNNELESAIQMYNDAEAETDYPSFYYFEERDIQSNTSFTPMLLSDLIDDEGDESPETDPAPVIMEVAGAICRGNCGQYNEYAYPDRLDGTYICYSCKS